MHMPILLQRSLYAILCLALLLIWQAPAHAAKAHATKPMLHPEVPQEDLSMEPDPSEVADQAVKEYQAGHMAEAQKLFQKVLSLDPSNCDAHFNLGAIREWANDLPGALAHYQAALKLKPNDREIQDAVAAVQYKIQNKTALDDQARRARQAHDLAMHSEMAKEAFASQNYYDAVTHLNYLAKVMPQESTVQFALGQSLRALKDYQWAAYRLKMAIYLEPNNDLYRKALVDLDNEVQQAQGNALEDAAQMALRLTGPLSAPTVAETGLNAHDF